MMGNFSYTFFPILLLLSIGCREVRAGQTAEAALSPEYKALQDALVFSSLEALHLGDPDKKEDDVYFNEYWNRLEAHAQRQLAKGEKPWARGKDLRKDALRSLAAIARNLDQLGRLWNGTLRGMGILSESGSEHLTTILDSGYKANIDHLMDSVLKPKGDVKERIKNFLSDKLRTISMKFKKFGTTFKKIGMAIGTGIGTFFKRLVCISN